jgi:signal transduction histidine kinase
LGLPIARHILEIHNGRIWVEPNTPVGSVFHVVLPAAEAPAAPAAAGLTLA